MLAKAIAKTASLIALFLTSIADIACLGNSSSAPRHRDGTTSNEPASTPVRAALDGHVAAGAGKPAVGREVNVHRLIGTPCSFFRARWPSRHPTMHLERPAARMSRQEVRGAVFDQRQPHQPPCRAKRSRYLTVSVRIAEHTQFEMTSPVHPMRRCRLLATLG
jgi:hypothetical protein